VEEPVKKQMMISTKPNKKTTKTTIINGSIHRSYNNWRAISTMMNNEDEA
jgi:hypothetical protein